jgi:hypothetical protein
MRRCVTALAAWRPPQRVELRSDRHCTRVAGARPRGQEQQKPRVRARGQFVALSRGELDHQARAAGHALAADGRKDPTPARTPA